MPGTCASLGKNCGQVSDGCGGSLNCGGCIGPDTCGGGSQANVCGCTPATCGSLGAQCGQVPDGCGGVLSCGGCTSGVCGGGGANKCGTNSCTPATCTSLSATCGVVSDGCANVLDCGGCTAPQSCGGGSAPLACGCTAKSCSDLGANCGTLPDGCGGTVTCGACGTGESCGGGGPNTCGPATCSPQDCAAQGRDCGQISDGCGNLLTCGSCTLPGTCGGSGVANLCGCASGTCPTLSSISVSPSSASVAQGGTQAYVATAHFSDGSTLVITAQATWTTGDPNVATVTSAGVATAVANTGSTSITASYGGQQGSGTLVALGAALSSIEVTPVGTTLAAGTQSAFTATGIYTDGSHVDITTQVTWSSSPPGIVSVSNNPGSVGVVSATSPGTASVMATSGSISGSTTVTVTSATLVSIGLTPPDETIAQSTSLQYTATGTFSDGSVQDITTQVTWASSDGTTASISSAGLASGLSGTTNGTTITISAKLGTVTGSTTLTVTNATLTSIDVFPDTPLLAINTQQAFTASGNFSDGSTQDLTTQVTWGSSAPSVASVSNAAGLQGQVSALAAGQTVVSATLGTVSGSTQVTVSSAALVSIAVTPASATIAVNTTQAFVATGTFADGSTQDITAVVTWSAASPTVAVVSNANGSDGVATGLAGGTTAIYADWGGVRGTASLTVSTSVLVSIAVTPASARLPFKYKQQFTAVGTYSDGHTQALTALATWASSNTTVATISNAAGTQGLATALSTAATVSITATYQGIVGTASLKVANFRIQSIAISPATLTLAVGQTYQLTAIGTFMDGTTPFTLDVTSQVHWSSSNKGRVSVTNKGLVRAKTAGSTVTITASKQGKSGTAVVTVP